MNDLLYQLADFSIRINSDEVDGEFIAILLFSIIGVVFVAAMISLPIIMKKDKNKPLRSEVASVVEVSRSNMGIEWYVIEFEDGRRKRLRNLNATSLIMAAGDKGLISYRGDTIESFERNGRMKKSIFDENTKEEKGEWRCPYCDTLNFKSVTRCIKCGELKPKDEQSENEINKDQTVGSNEWQCPTCGRVNQNYVGTCGCGTTKPR